MTKHYCQDEDCIDLQSVGWGDQGYKEGSAHPSGLCYCCWWWQSDKNALNFLFAEEDLARGGRVAEGWVRTTLSDQTVAFLTEKGWDSTEPSMAKVYKTKAAADAEADFSLDRYGCPTEAVMAITDYEKFFKADPTW